jgi:hypothetical protein
LQRAPAFPNQPSQGVRPVLHTSRLRGFYRKKRT